METTFEKNGTTRTVASPRDAVYLAATGWREIVPELTDSEGTEVRIAVPPPKSGVGSSRDHWAEFACLVDVEITEAMDRTEIIAAIQAAGIATEIPSEGDTPVK